MTPELLLFLLRLLSAALLLSFFAALLWFLYRDLHAASSASDGVLTPKGVLRVITSESGRPALDTAYPLLPVTTVGRHHDNTIVLHDSFVSGRHAVLAQRESGWWLEDLGSRNGTMLNSLLLTDGAVVSAGDVITVGGVELRIELPNGKHEANNGESESPGFEQELRQ